MAASGAKFESQAGAGMNEETRRARKATAQMTRKKPESSDRIYPVLRYAKGICFSRVSVRRAEMQR